MALAAPLALASGPGPNGINIGFDFNWSYSGPLGYSASFIDTVNGSGATLNNCSGGAVTASTRGCNFAFAYNIGGVPQTAVTPGSQYKQSWSGGCSSGTQPLTLFNCFNTNSFGEVFVANASGTLSGLTMRMTCLNPAGSPPTGLYAVLYQVNSGNSIPGTPLAQTPVDLSGCPTLTNWTGHSFSAADFAAIPLNFSNVNLTAGTVYGVFFGGTVPGAPLPGANTTPAAGVPTLSEWGTILLAGILAAIGAWKMRRPAIA